MQVRKTRVVGEKKSIKENKAEEIDSLCVFDILQDLRKIFNRLHDKYYTLSQKAERKIAKRREYNLGLYIV